MQTLPPTGGPPGNFNLLFADGFSREIQKSIDKEK